MHPSKVLIVEDDDDTRFSIATYLRNNGFTPLEADCCAQAEHAVRSGRPQVIVADYQLPDGTALDLLERIAHVDGRTPLIVLTGHGSIDLAVQAIKLGAEHFLTKPVALPALHAIIEKTLEKSRALRQQIANDVVRRRTAVDPFVGESETIARLREQAELLRNTDRPVLVRGETGTGKGVLARWLHDNSDRASRPMIELNCAGLPSELLESEVFGHEKGAFTGAAAAKVGLMEAADGGTLFLDEIGDMAPQLQPKLLKAVEDGRIRRVGDTREIDVDVRLIAATHRDLLEAVRQQRFRDDLYFRISTFTLHLPPLRERRDDIATLADSILQRLCAELSRDRIELSGPALQALSSYDWPGNIRELRNILERALLVSNHGAIGREHLAFESAAAAKPTPDDAADDMTLEKVEELHIRRVLRQEEGNVERAARRLGVSRSSLYQKLKIYRIER